MEPARALLAVAVCVAIIAIVTILARLFTEYQRETLTTKTLLVGGFLLAGIFGLFFAGTQVLVQGTGH